MKLNEKELEILPNQKSVVLKHLIKYKRITRSRALNYYGISNLSSVISEIKKGLKERKSPLRIHNIPFGYCIDLHQKRNAIEILQKKMDARILARRKNAVNFTKKIKSPAV